nr:unnamed protein product [Digitaria exilis]
MNPDLAQQPRSDRLYPVAGLAIGHANNPRFVASDGVPSEAMIVGSRGTSAYRRSVSLSQARLSCIDPKRQDLVFIIVLLNPSPMGSKIDQDDIPGNIEDLDEKGRQKYLMALAHLQSGFLKGFNKDQDTVTRVQEFVMPSFKMNDDKIEPVRPPQPMRPPVQPVASPQRLLSGPALLQAVRPAAVGDRLQQAVRPAYIMVVQRR